jgi:hypothetical protein
LLGEPHNEWRESALSDHLTTRIPVDENLAPGLLYGSALIPVRRGIMNDQALDLEIETTIWEGLDSWLSQWTLEA